MKFEWNDDTIRWYQEANEYTGFFKHVAELIAPRLAGYATMCDIGCGLGLLDLELCNSIEHITCIDISQEAINALQKTLQDRNITNIETRTMDCNEINENWDVITISFFGSSNLEEFLPRCKKLFAVITGSNATELTSEKYCPFKKHTVPEIEQALQLKGIPYSLTQAAFEFGQPLASREDAIKFVQSHSPGISPEDLANFLSERLVETGEERIPFFLPRMKSIGIFEIEGR